MVLPLFLKLSYSFYIRRQSLFWPDMFSQNTSVFIRALFKALMLTERRVPVGRPDHSHLLLAEATRNKASHRWLCLRVETCCGNGFWALPLGVFLAL